MRKESDCLGLAEIIRMALAMEENIPLDPMNIRLLRAAAVVQAPDRGANLIQQPGRSRAGWTMFLENSILGHGMGNNLAEKAD